MRDYYCDYPDCHTPCDAFKGGCGICDKYICSTHDTEATHPCAKLSTGEKAKFRKEDRAKDVAAFTQALRALDLPSIAEALRPGRKVTSTQELLHSALPRGKRNIHVPIEFDDGVKWMARVRQNRPGHQLALHLNRLMIASEVATMKCLGGGGLPVPEVVSPVYTEGERDFYFVIFIPGKSCNTPIWGPKIPRDQTSKTIAEYAAFNIRRLTHAPTFRTLGSLQQGTDPDGTFTVGPLNFNAVSSSQAPHLRGPFKTSAEKWTTIYDCILSHIVAGKAYTDRREMAFLVHKWIRNAVAHYDKYQEEGETYIVHEDGNGGHIMIDEQGSITGVIDWENASVGSKWEAFAAPLAFWDSHLYFKGYNELSFAELELCDNYAKLGRSDLAECVREGKVFQRLTWLVESQPREWTDFRQIKALGQAMGLEMPGTMEEFMAVQKEKYGQELGPIPGV